jgi:2-polyprenyl-3-methyl-5-hydroxy-6-metoxy-1,4-benzoquinol methylase
MSYKNASQGDVTGSAIDFDFSRRAYLSELLDEPCSYNDLRGCLRDLEQVNRVSFGYRPTLQWLEQFVPEQKHPLHIVDVGCGGGDMLRRIESWAAGKHVTVKLTGVDLNPHAIRAAREFTSAESRIEWIAGEAYSLNSKLGPIDVVISSLFTHHLTDDEIVGFIRWMERVARHGWFINDLYRSQTTYTWFKVLAVAMRWHRFVRHDGPVSFQRAFLPDEWIRYAQHAGLFARDVSIANVRPGRLCVGRVKTKGNACGIASDEDFK